MSETYIQRFEVAPLPFVDLLEQIEALPETTHANKSSFDLFLSPVTIGLLGGIASCTEKTKFLMCLVPLVLNCSLAALTFLRHPHPAQKFTRLGIDITCSFATSCAMQYLFNSSSPITMAPVIYALSKTVVRAHSLSEGRDIFTSIALVGTTAASFLYCSSILTTSWMNPNTILTITSCTASVLSSWVLDRYFSRV